MPRKHSLLKKIQESSPPTNPTQDSLPVPSRRQEGTLRPNMRFNRINVYLRYGILFFFLSFILLVIGARVIWLSSSSADNGLLLLLSLPFIGLISAYVLFEGILVKRGQVLLGETKMAINPRFVWEKRVIIGYRQIVNVSQNSSEHERQSRYDSSIVINYRHNNTNDGQIRTMVIEGVEKENQLLLELQQRTAVPKYVSHTIRMQDENDVPSKTLQGMRVDESPQKTTSIYWLLIFIILLLGSQVVFYFLSAQDSRLRAQLPESGIHTTGIVIEHQYYKGRFFIITEYEAITPSGETQNFIQKHVCTEEQYQKNSDGSQIPIIYSPKNPKISDISGNNPNLNKYRLNVEGIKRMAIFLTGPILVIAIIQSIRKRLSTRKKSKQ